MGLTEEQLRDISAYEASDAFTPLERQVLELAVEMTRTPSDVPAELYEGLRKQIGPEQFVELVAAIAQENFRARFNRPFGIQSPGFSEGAFCPLPESPTR